MARIGWALLLAAAVCLALAAAAAGEQFVVETSADEVISNNECSLREAVILANGGADNDCGQTPGSERHEIVVDASVTPVLYLTIPDTDEDASADGDLDVAVSLTIRSRNGRVAIDALGRHPVLEILSNAAVTLQGLHIRNGYSALDGHAGGVTNAGSGKLTLRDVVMTHNIAEELSSVGAAGAVASDGVVDATDCVFEYNQALSSARFAAGAVYASASVLVRSSSFRYNKALSGASPSGEEPVSGGAIAVNSASAVVNVFDSSFVENHGDTGGAVCADEVSVTLHGTELLDNTATFSGGAVFTRGDVTVNGESAAPSLLRNSALSGWGGVVFALGRAVLSNTGAVQDNWARYSGGVAYAQHDATLTLVTGRVADNVARGESGGVLFSSEGTAELSYVSGDVSGNTAGIHGGVLFASDHLVLAGVGGRVAYNYAAVAGGVMASYGTDANSRIEDVGAVVYNKAGFYGGVAYVAGARGDFTLQRVNGDVAGNSALISGGVAMSVSQRATIQNVSGNVSDNSAYYGGVMAVQHSVSVFGMGTVPVAVLRYVDGHVSDNRAGYGGVVYANGSAEIAYVGGDVRNNTAQELGGVVVGLDSVLLHDVAGSVSENRLVGSSEFDEFYYNGGYYSPPYATRVGGVVASYGPVSIFEVKGSLSDNSVGLSGAGGIVFTFDNIAIRNVEGGLERNVGLGSIAYTPQGSVDVDAVGGSIAYNTGPAVYAGVDVTLSNVAGSIIANRCALPSTRLSPFQGFRAQDLLYDSGGVAFGGNVLVDTVGGSISYNTCYSAGALRGIFDVTVRNVTGALRGNVGQWGGVSSANGIARIENVGDVLYNVAHYQGGVAWAGGTATLENAGAVVGNVGQEEAGGVLFSYEAAVIRGVGRIEHNFARRGGVLYAYTGAEISYVSGDIAYNSSVRDGGVVFAPFARSQFVLLEQIDGSVSYNSAERGGVVAADASVIIRNVTGDIAYNAATFLYGAVLAADDSVLVQYIGGGIIGNASAYGGGAIYSVENVRVEYVGGGVQYNTVGGGYGGAIYAEGQVHISHITGGGIRHNVAGGGGGAAYSNDASITVDYVNGPVNGNVALDNDGGAFYCQSALTIRNIYGSIFDNRSGDDGGVGALNYANTSAELLVENVAGSIFANSAYDNGGAFYTRYGATTVRDVYGAIFDNQAEHGGLVYARGPVLVQRVGPILRNHATDSGGVVRGYAVTIEDVYGEVAYNDTASDDGRLYDGGAVIYAYYAAILRGVLGDVHHNVSNTSGGVVYLSRFGRAVIESVSGDVSYNEGGDCGGVVCANDGAVLIQRISGSISNNRLRLVSIAAAYATGGVASARYGVVIQDVGGSISGNASAASRNGGHGGVAYSRSESVLITRVGGEVAYNRAGGSGGVAYAYDGAELYGVGGGVHENAALGGGGVLFVRRGPASVYDIGGALERNTSGRYGGVAYAFGNVYVSNIAGNVSYNRADRSGAVAYTERGSAELTDVAGDVSNNVSGYHGGVLAFNFYCGRDELEGLRTGVVSRVAGSVSYNVARYGGVVSSEDGCAALAEVSYVAGDVSWNVAAGNDEAYGGVVYLAARDDDGTSEVLIADVGGSVSHNTVSYREGYGGVVCAADCSARLLRIGGDVSHNSAYYGGAIYADLEAHIADVGGSVSYNSSSAGGVIYVDEGEEHSVTIRNITGPLHANRASQDGAGIVYGPASGVSVLLVENVGGITANTSDYLVGGFYWNKNVVIRNVNGPISYNSAKYGSAVVRSDNDSIVIENVGEISYNVSGYYGAFYAFRAITIDGVHGDFAYNRGLKYTDAVTGGLYGDDIVVRNLYGGIYGNHGVQGGAFYVDGGSFILSGVHGDIAYNTADYGGAFYAISNSNIEVTDVLGSIHDNVSRHNGGFLYAAGPNLQLRITNVAGSIERNASLEGSGGFAYSSAATTTGPFIIRGVAGDVQYNSAAYDGGFVRVRGPVTLEDFGGSIRDCQAGRVGGAVYATSLKITNLGGDIERCVAGGAGGFAYLDNGSSNGEANVVVENVTGSIRECLAETGGFLYVAHSGSNLESVTITNVGGDITRNVALGGGGYYYGDAGYGGVVDVYGPPSGLSVLIEHVGGNVTDNEAEYSGGVIAMRYGTVVSGMGNAARLLDVAGDVSDNKALTGSGGVIYVYGENSEAEVSGVVGRICSNTAALYGGVIAATGTDSSGTVISTGSSPIQANRAIAGDGGVVFADESASVDAGDGIVSGNLPQTVYSAQGPEEILEQVRGSVVLEAGGSATITIDQQPSDGVENAPLPRQPHVSVGGAQPAHELPLRVVAVLQDGSEVELEGPFNAVFDDNVEFQDVALPFAAVNVQLRIELVTVPCNATDEVVLESALTDPFNVTECASPAPVACPADIEVVNKQHECSAFVEVPTATSAKCANPIVEHSTTPVLDASQANGEYPVGRSFVTYTLSTSLGVSDECQVRITVVDQEAPVLSCPEDVTVFTDAGQCGAAVQLSSPTVEDNCDPAEVAITRDFPASFFPLGATTVTFRGVDDAGNVGTCAVTVTVVDNEAPEIVCPGNVVVGCGALPSFQAPVGTDNCPGSQTVQRTGPAIGSTTPLPPGLSTFTFEVTDAQGERATCSFTATTEDQWYLDADGDGVGAGEAVVQCPAPGPNYVADRNSDCDDANPNVSVLRFPDADLDGFGNSQLPVCTAPVLATKRGVPAQEVPLLLIGGDCNDQDPEINPNALELCNGVDDNCDGRVDEGCEPPAPPPSIPTVPVVPLPPNPPVASEATVIILPTPLPQSPPSPVDPIIIVQPAVFTVSAASSLVACSVTALLAAVLAALW